VFLSQSMDKIVKNILCVTFLTVILYIPGLEVSFADTILMRNNEQIKGVVVEEYKDRIILSTVDGEREILRDQIRKIIFEFEEQNLTSLGDFYKDRGLFRKAYYYYSKALELNPDYKRAKEGLNYAGTHIQQTGRIKKLSHIQRLNQQAKWEKGTSAPSELSDSENMEKQIKSNLGISLKNVKESFEVSGVVLGSPASKAGIHKGDIILAVWGGSISYMSPNEVMEKLATPGVMDIQMTFSRSMVVKLPNLSRGYDDLFGAKLSFSEMDGLIVEVVHNGSATARAGLKKDDAVIELQGQSTRYMSMQDVIRTIDSRRGESIVVKIKRDVVLWKKF
jgi:membrane-associated protease RseP (regulator of RpoE activity)